MRRGFRTYQKARKGFRSIQKVRRGIRSHGSLGWYTGRNKGVRREYRSHRRLGDAFGDRKVTIGLEINRKVRREYSPIRR
jgi:hypothetical protein